MGRLLPARGMERGEGYQTLVSASGVGRKPLPSLYREAALILTLSLRGLKCEKSQLNHRGSRGASTPSTGCLSELLLASEESKLAAELDLRLAAVGAPLSPVSQASV